MGSGSISIPCYLGLSSGYPHLPIHHCYVFLFNFLILCTSLLSLPISNPAPSFFPPSPLSPRWLLSSTSYDYFVPLFYVGLKHPHFGLPFSFAPYGFWVISWVFWALGLISTYQWVHTICVLLCLGYLTQDDIFLVPSENQRVVTRKSQMPGSKRFSGLKGGDIIRNTQQRRETKYRDHLE